MLRESFQGNFSTICDEEKIQLSDVRNRAEQSIIYILEARRNKIPFSRAVIDSIRSTDYPADSVMHARLRDNSRTGIIGRYAKNTHARHLSDVSRRISKRKVHRTSQRGRKQTALSTCGKRSFFRNFKAFFDNADMQKFFRDKDSRLILRRSVRFTTISCSSTSTVSKKKGMPLRSAKLSTTTSIRRT